MSSDCLAYPSIESIADTISSALHAVHEIEPATADDIQSWKCKWKPEYPVPKVPAPIVQDFDGNTFRFVPHGEEKVCEISTWPEAGDQKKNTQFGGAHCESHGRQTQNLQESYSQNSVHPSQYNIPHVQLVILGPRKYVSRRELANLVTGNDKNLGNVQDDISREIIEHSQEESRAKAIRKESICILHSWQQKAREVQNAVRAEFKAVPIEKANQLHPRNKRFKSEIAFSPSPTKVNGKNKSLKIRKGKGKLVKKVLASDKFVVQSIGMLRE